MHPVFAEVYFRIIVPAQNLTQSVLLASKVYVFSQGDGVIEMEVPHDFVRLLQTLVLVDTKPTLTETLLPTAVGVRVLAVGAHVSRFAGVVVHVRSVAGVIVMSLHFTAGAVIAVPTVNGEAIVPQVSSAAAMVMLSVQVAFWLAQLPAPATSASKAKDPELKGIYVVSVNREPPIFHVTELATEPEPLQVAVTVGGVICSPTLFPVGPLKVQLKG